MRALCRLPLFAVLAIAFSLSIATPSRADHGSVAMDLWGKFVSFQDGVLTIDIPSGKLAGKIAINVPNGVPVLVYTSPGHPTTSSSPRGLNNVPKDTPVEVNIDSRQRIIRISIGDAKPGKKK